MFPCGALTVALFGTIAFGLETFDTEHGVPQKGPNIVDSPKTRGTYNILWTCVFTLFTCTWTVQHLNIPAERSGELKTVREKIYYTLHESLPKVLWMLIAVIAPELLVAFAFQDWIHVRNFFKIVGEISGRDKIRWKKLHVLYANMGGFVIKIRKVKNEGIVYTDRNMILALQKVAEIEDMWYKLPNGFNTSTRQELGLLIKREQKIDVARSTVVPTPAPRNSVNTPVSVTLLVELNPSAHLYP